MSCSDYKFLSDRIAATEATIADLENAELLLATGGVQSYTLDTGQTRQTVTRVNMTELRKAIDAAYNRRATLIARRDGSGVSIAGPSW